MAKNIFVAAKSVQRKNPKLSWQQAIKKASRDNKQGKRKKVGAYKVIERGESKRTPPKKTVQVVRSKAGTFKGYKKVGSVKSTVQNRLKNALWDYEKATTIKATKEARKRIIDLRKKLKSL